MLFNKGKLMVSNAAAESINHYLQNVSAQRSLSAVYKTVLHAAAVGLQAKMSCK